MAAQSDLLWRVEYGNRQLQHLVHDDPQRALAFLGLAGASLLLMSDALPHVRHLRVELEAARRAGADYSTTSTGAADSTAAGSFDTPAGLSPAASSNLALDGLSGLDTLGGLDSLDALDTLAGLDLSTLDGLDTAMSAVDSGVDSGAGGDGGSDGGGGDGGGGDSGS